jgi:ESCRT-II complex subunit VPS36
MQALEVTASGRPQLAHGEIECLAVDGARLEYDGRAWTCTAVVTSQRVLFVEAALGFELCTAASVHARSSGFLGRGEGALDISIRLPPADATGAAPDSPPAAGASLVPLTLRLKSASVRDQFREQLLQQQKRADIERRRAQQTAVPAAFTTTNAGISGIIRSQGHSNAAVERTVDRAFTDLDSLMAHAKELVELAQRLAARAKSAQQDERDATQEAELDRFRLFGIASPVTRVSHGASFPQELARQLADFLVEPLEASHGVLALTDVFCLFNRARGTELVSPSDLLQACELCAQLSLPIRTLTFSSGVLAVRLLRVAEGDLEARIVALACQSRGVTAIEVGLGTGISALLAHEFLLTLELQGRLCRDGMRRDSLAFYPNIFAETAEAKGALASLRGQAADGLQASWVGRYVAGAPRTEPARTR